MNNLDIKSGIPVETLFKGHIVTCELSLGCPLGCKNEFLGLCRPYACQHEQASEGPDESVFHRSGL